MIAIQSCRIPKTVKFVKHEVLEHQTLASTLYGPLDLEDDKDGLIYIYTHKQDPFLGMLKIGYTCSRILHRLNHWTECGHGYPTLLWSHTQVRHPRRVELLTHFELLDFWHEQQYCSFHKSSHVEWFKTDLKTATTIISDWSSWMESNPYDRRGNLKSSWEDTIKFLELYEIPPTAKTMLQIHQLELGILKVSDFMDDRFCNPLHGSQSEETPSAVTDPNICNLFREFPSEASNAVIDKINYDPFLGRRIE